MFTFLIRDFNSLIGFSERYYADNNLPRSIVESYVPWAMTYDSKVIYAKYGEHRGFNNGKNIMPYTAERSKERRSLCQSELGLLALSKPVYSLNAVNIVSQGIRRYLMSNYMNDNEKVMNIIAKQIGHYFFTGGRLGFGRISIEKASTLEPKYIWTKILLTLEIGTVEQKLAIHDAVGRKILPILKGTELIRYKSIASKVRQEWFDQSDIRGRVKKEKRGSATNIPGIADRRIESDVGYTMQIRDRAVDSFERDVNRTSHPEANDFFDETDARNLLFGGGISGTTGTLFQAAEAFGPLNSLELKKEYMLAIIGYLVGGGMHSYHESMVIGKKVGVPYNPGAYVDSLPTSFKNSGDFLQWNARYYDISTLGAIHWFYNNGRLPSHLDHRVLS